MTKLAVAMAVLVTACGGSGSISADEYGQELRDAFCRNFAKCGLVKDFDTCEKLSLFSVEPYVSASELAAFDMDKADFDGGSAKQCFDAIADAPCDLAGELPRALFFRIGLFPEACDQIFSGPRREGEACAISDECLSQFCRVPSCNEACCAGTCIGDTPPTRSKVGESCGVDTPCVNTAYCDASGTCMALKPLNATCTSRFECALDLLCVGAGATGTCVSLPKLGEPCQGLCKDIGAICTSGTCIKRALDGEACAADNACSPLYSCDISTGTGRCSGGRPLGGSCELDDRCADAGAFCDVPAGAGTGTCTLPKADGMPCEDGSQCVSHTCSAAGQCIAEPVCI